MKRTAPMLLALIALSSVLYAQQKTTNTNSAQNTQQVLAAEATVIADLSRQITELEKIVNELNTREKERAAADASRKLGLVQVKDELSNFDCIPEFDKTSAMALAERGTPSYAYQGAGAMNCTQRLASGVLPKLIEALDK